MPPDRDFVLDHVPGQPNIFVAIGAGHAYKFASLWAKFSASWRLTATPPMIFRRLVPGAQPFLARNNRD
ncbi:MAG: hypothetical protein R2867_43400 [Caldilineaceae bacterium]